MPKPLCSLWKRPPQFITSILNTLRLGESEPIRRTLQFAFRRGQQDPRLELDGGQEAAL